ncbi:MAG TPA: hypothetical protein P5274_02555 [Candidatus Paceibacterota bacterium]|nr:hypothetical protein [Candidatus Paceibacterota bacterium]
MTKLINLADLGKKTWSLYQKKFATFVGLLLVPFALLTISPVLYQSVGFFYFPLSLVLFGLGLFSILWAGTAAVVVLHERSKLTVRESLTRSWSKVWPLFWVGIIVGFVAGGGALLFLIPGIILSVYFIFAKLIVVVEGDKGMRALTRSREYVRGYFWPILGRFLAIVIVTGIIYLTLSFVASLLGDLTTLLLSQEIGVAILLITQALINVLISPLALTAVYVLYSNVRHVKGDLPPVQTKRQSVWYLVIGLAGWIFLLVMIALALIVLMSAVGGYLLGSFISDISNNSALFFSNNII